MTEALPPATSKPPWLSVIIPTYNGAKYLRAAFESVLEQASFEQLLEVLVIDDGSTDQTLAIVHEFSSRLPLKLIERGRQKSWVKNTNIALSSATGDYVTFLHQDDLWLPGRLAELRTLAETYPEAVLLLHDARFVDDAGKQLGTWSCPFPKTGGLLPPAEVFRRLIVQNFIAIPSPMFKRATVLSVGGMKEQLWYTADWDLWLRLSKLGPWAFVPKQLACFRIHSQSQTVQGSPESKDYRGQYRAVLTEFLPELPAGDRLRRVAQFSTDLNCQLAEALHGKPMRLVWLLGQALRLGPAGWYQYWVYSRIFERVSSRLFARLKIGAPDPVG